MPEIFIVDEWLWSDLNGENREQRQEEAFRFLKTLYDKCDRIAVAKGSRFQEKEWQFSKCADVIKRKIQRFYFGYIRLNTQKYDEVDIDWEEEIALEGINPDDVYLVKTYYKTKALIISTDAKLMSVLQSKGIPCKPRDIFLQEYL